MTNDANTFRAEFIANLNADIAECRQMLENLNSVMLGEGFVVMCGELPLTFDVTNRVVNNPRVTNFRRAMRFTRQDAETVAATVTNGNNETGRAVFVRDMLTEAIASAERLLENVQAIQ